MTDVVRPTARPAGAAAQPDAQRTVKATTKKPAELPSKKLAAEPPSAEETRHVSKLEAEVLRMEARGTALVQTEGQELEGTALLEKALRTRARFPALNVDSWQRAEQFVVVCNQLAVRAMQRLDDGYLNTANELMLAAERTLCNSGNDSFTGFHPLRQHLLGSTLCNSAALCVLNNQPLQNAINSVEKALAVEAPRPATLTMFNLAALQVRQSRFDEAMATATKVIALADHYLKLRLNLNPESEQAFAAFVVEAASHATLAHHLIASVASWAGTWHIAQHHAKLALRCAERYLGEHHALTTRAIHRVNAVQHAIITNVKQTGDGTNPPAIPLQMATFSSPIPPSRLLTFTLVAPYPTTVDVRADPAKLPPLFASSSPSNTKPAGTRLPAVGQHQPRQIQTSSLLSPGTESLSRTAAPLPSQLPPLQQQQQQLALTQPTAPRGRPPAQQRPAGLNGSSTSRTPAGAAQPLEPATGALTSRRLRDHALNATSPPSADGGGGANGRRPAPPPVNNTSGRHAVHSSAASASTLTDTTEQPHRRRLDTPDMEARDPVIEAWATPKVVSTIAKQDYEMYMQLQQEVSQFLFQQTVTSPSAPTTAMSAELRRGGPPRRARLTDVGLDYGDADVLDAVAVSDAALLKLSEVRPDHTAEDEVRWDAAARKLQRWARGRLAVVTLRKRQAAVARRLRQIDAVDSIAEAYWNYRLRCDAKRTTADKRRQKRLSEFFAETVQATARSWLSYAEYCRRVQAALSGRLRALRRQQRETIAATGIQACWRAHHCRQQIYHRLRSATRVQRFYRLYRAYLLVRTAVFQRRCFKRAVLKRRDFAALKIQVWWKHWIKQVRAKRILAAKRLELAAHLERKVEREALAWRRVAGVDEDAMAGVLQRFFRCVIWRRREHERQVAIRRRRGAASKIQRCYRWSKASSILERKRQERLHERAIKKRVQEVREAVMDIQRIARRFLARLQYRRLLRAKQHRHDAASILQRLYYVVRAVKVRRDRAEAREWAIQRYQIAADRQYAATKIQSIYRMRRDTRYAQEYRRFVGVERHLYAAKIQRAFRFFSARQVRHAILATRRASRDEQIARELREASAKRIQHAVRTYVVRRATKRRAAVPVTRQTVAVCKIQRLARYMLARTLVMRLLQAREHIRSLARGDEHLTTYAMIVQQAVRKYILMPKQVAVARAQRSDRAARSIQRFFRLAVSLRQTGTIRGSLTQLQEDHYDDEEREFAATRIQKIVRGVLLRQRRRAARSELARIQRRNAATFTIARAYRAHRSRGVTANLRYQREHRIDEQLAKERVDAATVIQRLWREFIERKREVLASIPM
jgi:hypothetical protein